MNKIPITVTELGESEAQAAYNTVLSGWVTQGPKVQEFEERFAEYVGSRYAIAVSSCTTALHLSLVVAGIEQGDEVICPSMSFIATANSIQYTGATPVFAEVNSDYNLDIDDVRQKITPRTKAIILVHQIGMPANIADFQDLCKEHGLQLIEDAACAAGSEYRGERVGSHSELVCFSFHPRKIITTGDGGMITTSNKVFAERLRLLRQHGMSINDRVRHESSEVIHEHYAELGYNYRLTDIQASIGIQQLEKIDRIIEERRKIARFYIKELSSLSCLVLPRESEWQRSTYQSFGIYLLENAPIARDNLMQRLLDLGIATRRGIMLIHKEPAYEKSHPDLNLPNSSDLSARSLLLPLFPSLTTEQLQHITSAVKALLTPQAI